MSPTITRRAYAKVNLSLDVGPREADGYHPIWSVFQTISLADALQARLTDEPGVVLTVEGLPAPCGPANIAYRAAEAALRAAGAAAGVRLHLTKRIPMEAGLGGGSADAAAALRVVEQLLGLDDATSGAEGLAASLGSDVPFLLRGGTALVRGNRGETVESLPDAPSMWLVVVKPASGVSTSRAYEALDRVPNRLRGRSTEGVTDSVRRGSAADLMSASHNDFEDALPELCPDSVAAMEELRVRGALAAHLCGSGSAAFGFAASPDAAEVIAASLRGRWPWVSVCRTVGAAETRSL